MKPDELVALAGAAGIDISHTIAAETNIRGAAARRRRTADELADGAPLRDSVEGKQTRVIRPRVWTHAEAGFVMGGCPRMPWLAGCYSWMGDRVGYKELHRGLTLEAIRTAQKQDWPWQIRLATGLRSYYIERLAELVLDAEGCKPAFAAAPGLFAIYMGITPQVWSKPVGGFYLTLEGRYQRWLDVARGFGARRLRNEEEDVAIA